jgi:hypothetical protein
MSLPATRPANQAVRCGNRLHAASIARQRARQNEITPHYNAQCIHRIIQKRMAEGQPIEDLSQYGLDDAAWSELVALLSNEEIEAVNAASGQDDIPLYNPVDGAFSDDEPIPFAVAPEPQPVAPVAAPKPELPRFAEPRFVHSLKWFDTDGIEHMHVVRSDDLDDVLRQVRTVKTFIAASKVRAEKSVQTDSAHSEPQAEAGQADSAYDEPEPEDNDYCPTHGRAKLQPSKFGGNFCTARMRNGEYCKFSSKKVAS